MRECRLARSTRDLLMTLAAIAEEKWAGFRLLGDGWADTTTAHGRREEGEETRAEIARRYNVHRSTNSRLSVDRANGK